MSSKSTWCLLVTFLIIIIASTIGLAMTIQFWYLAEEDNFKHRQIGNCQVLSCNTSTAVCYDGNICNIVSFRYALLNRSILTSYQNDYAIAYSPPYTVGCPVINSTMACYYDNRKIQQTLSLDAPINNAPNAIVMITLLSICILVFLLWCLCMVGIICCDNWDELKTVVQRPLKSSSVDYLLSHRLNLSRHHQSQK